MATTFRTRERYAADASALIKLYSDPGFHEAKARHLGAKRVHVMRQDQADGSVVLSIQTMRPASWAPGGKDSSSFTLRIDPATGQGSWERIQHGFEDKSDASGSTRIVTGGAGQSLVEVEGRLEVRIPMLGGMIEKRIIAAMEAESAREAEFVRSRLKDDEGE